MDELEMAHAGQSGVAAVVDLLVQRIMQAAHLAVKHAMVGMQAAQQAKHTECVIKSAKMSAATFKPGSIIPLDDIQIFPIDPKPFDWAFLTNEINKSASFIVESTSKGWDEYKPGGFWSEPFFKTKHKKYKASAAKVKKDSVKLDALTPALAEFMKDYTE